MSARVLPPTRRVVAAGLNADRRPCRLCDTAQPHLADSTNYLHWRPKQNLPKGHCELVASGRSSTEPSQVTPQPSLATRFAHGTLMQPGQLFEQTWTIQNTGTVVWEGAGSNAKAR